MAIQTELIYDIEIDGITVDTVGLSDTLDNYSLDEISVFGYCGAHDISRRNNIEGSNSISWVEGFGGIFNYPFTVTPSGGSYSWTEGATGYNSPEGLYTAVIWLMKTGGSPSPDHFITSADLGNYRLVTEWNVNKFVMTLPSLDGTLTNCAQTTWEQVAYPSIYCPQGNTVMTYHTDRDDVDDKTAAVAIYPYMLFVYNDSIYLHQLKFELADGAYIQASTAGNGVPASDFASTEYISIDGTHSIATCVNGDWCSNGSSSGWSSVPASDYPANNIMPITWAGPGGYTNWYHCLGEDEQNYVILFHHSGSQNVGGYIHFTALFAKVSDCLQYFANAGVYFYADKLYKPVIENSIVIGYSDDLTTESDIDSWDGNSDHGITPFPPVPPVDPDEDNTDPISTVAAPFGTGLAHYYVSTVDSTVLSHISEAMSAWDIDTSKKDLYRNLISCKIIKPPAGIPASPSTFEIYGVKPQYNGADITINEVTGNPSITFGTYNIPRKFNDFRDYAPYSKAEIFIPYCGWCALPSHVIGRSVSVEYFTDVIAGTVKAIVYCGTNVVAEAAGVMAVDVPFAAENVGAKVAAATTGLLSYGQGALQASAGIGQAVVSKGKQGTKNIANGLATVIGAYNQLAMTANENWTEINGKSGDGCCLAGISTIIIKITRPKYGNFTAPYYVPEDFPHTVGFIAMKKTTPAACTGLIICDNVDTSGITGATERERQLIKEYLESGIIVEHPE